MALADAAADSGNGTATGYAGARLIEAPDLPSEAVFLAGQFNAKRIGLSLFLSPR